MPAARFQPSFAAGVLGPGLHGRIDVAKYDVGLKVGLNVFVHAHGGVSNRTGTEFVCEVMDHTKAHKLIPFERDDDENYVMLMGDLSMKIIEDASVVQSGGGDYNPVTPFAYTDLPDLDYVQSIDVMYFAHSLHFPQQMDRSAATTWTFANLLIDPSISAPTGLSVTPAGAGTETYTYKVSPIEDEKEGFAAAEIQNALCADLSVSGAENVVAWTGSADEYNIYRERNGIFGYIGFTEDTSFTDDNISPNLEITPVVASTVFGGAGDYPSKVTMVQQRLTFANSVNQPETVWASRTGDYTNFTKSRITRAADMLETDLSGESINRIRGMLQLRELLVFASSGEFSIAGDGGQLLATQPIQTQFGYSGSIGVKPLVVEDTALFIDRTGRGVRDLRYAFEQDGYSGNDLSIFASHFFEGKTIAGWTFAKNPYSVVWVYLDDGALLSFTYKREHQVWAWCEHDVGGEVESIASIAEGIEDAVYMIVKRTIDGSVARYVERMHKRDFASDAPEDCFFVDCGLTYSGAAATTISGLDHLEGEEVVALADGNVVANLTVSSGSITLPTAAALVHVGLPFTAEIENLPPAIDLQDVGSARGRPIKANKVYVQVEKTRGIKAGPNRDKMTEFIQTGANLAADIPLFTGMVEIKLYPDWNRDGTVVIQQTYPLPMSILGLSPELTVGR